MKAIYLVRNGDAHQAFEWRDISPRVIEPDEVMIETEASGINFADISARLGNYKDCPPLPTIIGYEAVGRVVDIGALVNDIPIGARVVAFTRFGGYSQLVYQKSQAVAIIPEDMPVGDALALATQYCTAYYASHIATNVLPNDKVLVHAAAGGVGIALTQLCKMKGAFVYGTVGSDSKFDLIKSMGVDVAINYQKNDFTNLIKEPIDVAFDAVGADNFRKSYQLLNRGGRMVGYGAASFTDANQLFKKAIKALEFGIYHPAQLMLESKSMIGVNMLRIADYRPDILQHCMQAVIQLYLEGKIKPYVGKMYPATELAQAHRDMESRKTVGKIGIVY